MIKVKKILERKVSKCKRIKILEYPKYFNIVTEIINPDNDIIEQILYTRIEKKDLDELIERRKRHKKRRKNKK